MSKELDRLRASGGKWCFVDGHRLSRLARIRELEAKKRRKPKKKPNLSEGTDETDREAGSPEEA